MTNNLNFLKFMLKKGLSINNLIIFDKTNF